MLILASKSPARQMLLRNAGLDFIVRGAEIDERAIEDGPGLGKSVSRETIAKALAGAKARSVSAEHPDAHVIGADQTLECGSLNLHKPRTRTDAARQLRALSGRTHALHSAVALAHKGEIIWDHVSTAHLTLKDFTDAELDRVLELENGANLSSVGGYRLEGPSIRLFESVTGDYFTILGLPLLALLQALAELAPATLEGRAQ